MDRWGYSLANRGLFHRGHWVRGSLFAFVLIAMSLSLGCSTSPKEQGNAESRLLPPLAGSRNINIVPMDITESSFSFSLSIAAAESVETSIEASGEGYTAARDAILSTVPTLITLDKLNPDTSYSIRVSGYGQRAISFGVRTLRKTGKSQYRYFIDLASFEDSQVPVHILAQFGSSGSHGFVPRGYHTNGQYIRPTVFNENGKPTGGVLSESPAIMARSKRGESLAIRYISDKGPISTPDHGIQGQFAVDSLMVSGEQLLLAPEDLSEADSCYGSFILKEGWVGLQGYDADSYGVFDFRKFGEWQFGAINLYAYDSATFDRREETILGTAVSLVTFRGLESGFADKAMAIYRTVANLWRRPVGDPSYSILITADHDQVYGGEWTTGQGFSQAWGLGEMYVHQIYHRWNAWALGLPAAEEPFRENAWVEGFNEYFSQRVLFDMGLDPQMRYMREWYSAYRSTIIYNHDQSLLLAGVLFDPKARYYKGAVFAFALDRFIRDGSEGTQDLSYVLRRAGQAWDRSRTPVSLEAIKYYVKEAVPTGSEAWFLNYLVGNKPIVIGEFR